METSYDRLTSTPEDMRLYQRERALEAMSSLIYRTMKEENINQAQLAEILDVTPGRVTQLLDDDQNKTIHTISDVFTALGHKIVFSSQPIVAKAALPKPNIAFHRRIALKPDVENTGGSSTPAIPAIYPVPNAA